MPGGTPAPILEELAIKKVGQSTYENVKRLYKPKFARGVYGGQILGQAMMAASAEDVPSHLAFHSVHCYFVLGAIEGHQVTYTVTKIRDGGSFATRQVHAVQCGKLMFTLMASFHKPDPTPVVGYSPKLPSTHPPVEKMKADVNIGNKVFAGDHQDDGAAERPMEWVTSQEDVDHLESLYGKNKGDEGYVDGKDKVLRQWARCKGNMEKVDERIHAIAMAYVADTFSCMFVPVIHGFEGLEWMVSLDFTIYFHKRNIRSDKWWAVENTSPWAADGRGIWSIQVWDSEGDHCTTMTQEGLYRGAKKDTAGAKL